MVYALVVSGKAEKAIELLPGPARFRVLKALRVLTVDPFHGKKLNGKLAHQYSYRVGTYRIVYEIFKERLVVIIIDVSPRGGAY